MSRRDRERWEAKHAGAPAAAASPAAFLLEHVRLLPRGRTLDLAAGTGRNAAFLADRGHRVLAVDVARAALARLRVAAPDVACAQMDLDAPGIRPGSLDAIVVVSFLDRRLFPVLPSWLRPGGVLLWDTFLVDQRVLGHPRSAQFLLERGELQARLAPVGEVLAAREGLVREPGGPAWRAGIVIRTRGG